MWLYFLLFLPVAVIVWLCYEWLEHTWIQYNSTTVECQKLNQNEKLRVCLISDLHNNRKHLKKLIAHIREFSPQIILLAGDMVDKHKTVNTFAEQFLTALSKLEVPVYYSAGNHELTLSEEHPNAWMQYLASLPEQVHFLENSSLTLKSNPALCISGLSLPKEFYKKGTLYQNTEELPDIPVPEHRFHILLAHHPEYASMYQKYHPDFIVSGHLHGGLLRLPWVGGIVSPRLRLPKGCDAGLVKLSDSSQMYVSRGLGSHTIPLRFFNRVEVNFLVLKGTKE